MRSSDICLLCLLAISFTLSSAIRNEDGDLEKTLAAGMSTDGAHQKMSLLYSGQAVAENKAGTSESDGQAKFAHNETHVSIQSRANTSDGEIAQALSAVMQPALDKYWDHSSSLFQSIGFQTAIAAGYDGRSAGSCKCASGEFPPFADPEQYDGDVKNIANEFMTCGAIASEADCIAKDSCEWSGQQPDIKCVPSNQEIKVKIMSHMAKGCGWVEDSMRCSTCDNVSPGKCGEVADCEIKKCGEGSKCGYSEAGEAKKSQCMSQSMNKSEELMACLRSGITLATMHTCFAKSLSSDTCLMKRLFVCGTMPNKTICESEHEDLSCSWEIGEECGAKKETCGMGLDLTIMENLATLIKKEDIGHWMHDSIHCLKQGKAACAVSEPNLEPKFRQADSPSEEAKDNANVKKTEKSESHAIHVASPWLLMLMYAVTSRLVQV